MNITDVFPALLEKHTPGVTRQQSWTKRGPGRRHNDLTAREQAWKDRLMHAGMTASDALRHIHDTRG